MIVVNLDVMMAKRKMSLSQLSEKVDITLANLSILKNNKAKAVRFSTLEAICAALDCQPGDILEFVPACICRPRIFPAGGAALPAHVLQRRLAGSGIGPPAGVDPCVLLPLVSLGIRLWSRVDRGRWDPVYCGTSSADCIRRRSVCRSAPEGRRGRCGIS